MTDYCLGSDGKILHLNPSAKRLLGLQAAAEPAVEILAPLIMPVNLAELLTTGQQTSQEISWHWAAPSAR